MSAQSPNNRDLFSETLQGGLPITSFLRLLEMSSLRVTWQHLLTVLPIYLNIHHFCLAPSTSVLKVYPNQARTLLRAWEKLLHPSCSCGELRHRQAEGFAQDGIDAMNLGLPPTSSPSSHGSWTGFPPLVSFLLKHNP